MILEIGEKVHVITRRLFETDLRRHFIGEVIRINETAALIEGYTFIFDNSKNQYIRRPEKRSRIVGIADSGYIINLLPVTADPVDAKYVQSKENKLVVSDGKTFSLEINEFGASR